MVQRLKRLPAMREIWFNPWVRKIPWRRKWQPTPVFLPGESHGWRSLVGYSPRVAKSQTRLSDFTSLTILLVMPNAADVAPDSLGLGCSGPLQNEVAQSCPTLCDPMDCSPSRSSLHGILQARVLEWVAISFSRGSSQPRDRTRVSRIPGRHFNL